MPRTNPADIDPNEHAGDDDENDGDDDGEQLEGAGDDDGDDGEQLEDDDDDDDADAEDGEPVAGDDDEPDDDEREANPGDGDALKAYLRTLQLGAPFAISGGFEIVEAKIIVRHEEGPHAGKMFRVDLLGGKVKRSPYDGAQLTHALIVATPDDAEIVCDVVTHILEANGEQAP